MIKKYIFLVLYIIPFVGIAQDKYYNFNFYEGKNYIFTMNQSDDLVQNTFRCIGSNIVDEESPKWKKVVYHTSQVVFVSYLGQILTHEEGQRSVLSELGIHANNKPILEKVDGVTDETLLNLRNNDLPNFVRLHTGGVESDFAYAKKLDAYFNYGEETYLIMYWDYITRFVGSQLLYSDLISPHDSGVNEQNTSELNRDVVGHDLYGMIRHLHRPKMDFYRYTEWDDLTSEEKKYGKRMGRMALLNFLNPNIFRLGNFYLSDEVMANFSVSYSLAPFGDFVDQNAYLTINDKYKINPYLREYFNKSNTFLAGGIKLHNCVFYDNKFILNSSLDFWDQPQNLDFKAVNNRFGFGISTEMGVRFLEWDYGIKSAYINGGLYYKTNGFIPEAPSLHEDFGVHLGVIITVVQ